MTDSKRHSGPQSPADNDHRSDQSKQQHQRAGQKTATDKEKQRVANEDGKLQRK